MTSPSESLSSFEHVQLDDAAGAGPDKTSPAGEAAAGASPKPVAEAQARVAAPAAGVAAAGSPPVSGQAAAAEDEDTLSHQAQAALQSMFGFFGGVAAPADQDRSAQGSTREAGTGDVPAEAGGDPASELEKEALDAALQDAALQAEQAVKEVGTKLLHGAAEAKESLSSLAQGFSSWWSKLDAGMVTGSPTSAVKGSSGSRQRVQDVQQAADSLGLDSGETVLESFGCTLLQTYTCSSNFFTPVRQIPFAGSLHITSQRLCFAFEDKGIAPIKLPGKDIKSVAKLAADGKAGLPERLELHLQQAGQTLVLAQFALEGLEMDSALALVEHLAEEQ